MRVSCVDIAQRNAPVRLVSSNKIQYSYIGSIVITRTRLRERGACNPVSAWHAHGRGLFAVAYRRGRYYCKPRVGQVRTKILRNKILIISLRHKVNTGFTGFRRRRRATRSFIETSEPTPAIPIDVSPSGFGRAREKFSTAGREHACPRIVSVARTTLCRHELYSSEYNCVVYKTLWKMFVENTTATERSAV